MTFEEICRELSETAGPRTAELVALAQLYWAAQEEAKEYGYVGVGCITYAQEKLKEAQG